MENTQFVTYDLALKLKELGVKSTLNYYWLSTNTQEKPFIYNSAFIVFTNPAYTIFEVLEWLRLTYGIWIAAYYNKNKSFFVSIVDECDNFIGSGLFMEDYKSPNEAYIAAIDYTLNNLI